MAAETTAFTNWTFYRDALVVSLVLYLGSACRLRHRDDRSTAAQPPHRA